MVGVPKSKRCRFCAERKTKCDEKWPTCGTCARAGKICSGAKKDFKFIVNGNHNESTSNATNRIERTRLARASTASKRVAGGSVIADSNQAPIGHSSLQFTSHPQPYKSRVMDISWSSEDHMTARLVGCLDAMPGTGNDLRILGAFLPLLPQQLGRGNKALDYAVELLLGAWTNCRRGLPSHLWLDLNLYIRAIRSLNNILHDGNPEVLNNTFAAQYLLQKTEVLYDFRRGSNEERHGTGLIALIAKAGPAQLMSEMALHVMFEGLYHMLQEDIRQTRDSVFHRNDWMMALTESIDASSIDFVLKQLYHLWAQATAWPGLVRLVRLLHGDPSNIGVAEKLHMRAMLLARFLHFQDVKVMSALGESGDIFEVENLDHPALFRRRFEFSNFSTAKLFTVHAMVSIITCRVLQEANRFLGRDDPSVEKKATWYSRRIWMSYPWMQNQAPLAVDYTAALAFSYESGDGDEREFCIRGLRGMEAFRRPPPVGEWTDATIKANAKAFTGRLPFLKTQDPRVEYDGIGCRSGGFPVEME